ncbi:hypothetical protein RclHR1_08430007 [Rhizophagus clarus]|uniref:Acetyl-CoA synthetase-like protein n=1 Tax=Rhizophagus clarus TaxID=94130 RepID=A0A2Z6S0G4_9GLOM|nr:hypothetical protein RclHR1_08430007 [Rhizophagus clarus]
MYQTIILGSILLVTLYVLKRLRDPKLNVPLVHYKIPFIGHTLSYMFNCEEFFKQCRKEYGDIFSLYLFGQVTTFVGKDHSHEVLSRDDVFDFTEEFRRRVPGDAMFANINGFGDPKYNAKVVKEYISNKLSSYTERMQKSLYLATQKYIGDCDNGRTIYSFYHLMTKIISTPIANIFIGEEEADYDEIITTFAEFTTDVAVFFAIPPILDFIYPGLQDYVNRIPIKLGLFNPAKKHRDVLVKHIKNQVDKRLREKQKYGDSWKRPNDLLQDFMEEEKFDPNNVDYEVMANKLCIFIFASVHTTSRSCANAIMDLASRPEYMQELYEEQLEVHKQADENGILSFEALIGMKKLDSFIKESLRLTGDVAALPHYVMKDYTFSNGLHVPKGHVVDIYFSDVYQDESLQGSNPNLFEPFRHLNKNSPASKVSKNFLIFGGGKHACPGRFFAVNEIKFFMHNAILKYNFRTESGKIENKMRLGPITFPNIEIPTMGIYQYVTSNPNGIKDDKVIFTDSTTDKKLSYGEFKSNSKRLAAGLIDKAGLERGNVLAIISPNQVDYAVVSFGTIIAGGTVTFINPLYTVDELTYQLKDSSAKYIIAFPSVLSNVIRAAAAANIHESNIFLFGDTEINGIKPYSSLISEREANPVEYSPEAAKSTTAYLCYSSGTTGRSKGVETTHFNIVANLAQLCAYDSEVNSDTIYIGLLPFFHIYGLCVIIHLSIFRGASVVVIPKFNLSTFCRIIQDYRVNRITVVPPIVLSLVKDPIVKNYDLSSLRVCVCGAAPLSKELSSEFTKMYNIPIKQGYGLTETSPATHSTKIDNIIPGSIGKPLPNIECKIISEDGEELGVDQPGELCVRGPNIMKGYLNNKEATDSCIDSEGWFHTGDIATVDKSGNFYIIDRVKELIKYKGFQVPPTELEAILLTHPLIADAAVVGVYSEKHATEVPIAYVTLQPNIPQSDQIKKEIEGFIAQQAADHKRLRGGVLFIDQIPKSTSGKILRRLLRDRVKIEHPFYKL